MDALKNLINKFIALDTDIIMFKTMSANPFLKDVITELNTKKQLHFGELSDGSMLPDYSDVSKDLFDKPDGPIRLYDTGAFYKSFEVILSDDGFYINADDKKIDEDGSVTRLFKVYGKDVAGLTDENKELFIKQLLPRIANEITRILLS